MHEYSLVNSLLDRIDAEARARRAIAVHRVTVKVGELSGVETDLLVSAYELLRERSICAGAELEVASEAALWRCPECDHEAPAGAAPRCPSCERPLGLVAGNEIILERIEMEVP